MTGPLRYTDRDPFKAMSKVQFTDPDDEPVIGPFDGFDVYSSLRNIMGFCKCPQCTSDICDILARRRNVFRRPARR